jgi:hypothetical protein
MKRKLSIELSQGESVTTSGPVKITLEQKSGRRARILFVADDSVRIDADKPSPLLETVRKGVMLNS